MKMGMRIAIFAAAVVLLPALLVAQLDPGANPNLPPPNGPQGAPPPMGTQPASATSMHDSLGAPGMTGQQMADREFMRTATEGGIADMKMGMLAVEKGGPEVKELARKMVEDHAAINKDMAAVADSTGVLLPKKMNKDEQAEYDKLSGLSGKDFDTEYMTYIVQAHWRVLHNFYMEASVASDPGLESEVVKAMRMMHDHLGLIAKAATAEGITLPPRPPRPSPPAAPETAAPPPGH